MTDTYCYICAKIAKLIETKNQLVEVRDGEYRATEMQPHRILRS